MKIAIAGKGGTGKTTLSGTLARFLARRSAGSDRSDEGKAAAVWAVDADTSPNLARIVGIDAEVASELTGLPGDLLEKVEPGDGNGPGVRLTVPAGELVERFGAVGPDGLGFLLVGRVDHAGAG